MIELIPHSGKDQSLIQFGNATIIDPAQVMVKTSSGYKILDLCVRNSTGHVYAKNGQYYICLMRSGLTSNPKITWVELDGLDEIYDHNYLTYFKPQEVKNEKD